MMSSLHRDLGPICVIVTGMPGSGKSTVARVMAASITRAARVSGDEVSGMILSGRVWALGSPVDEAEAQTRLTFHNIATLANNFTTAGFTVFADVVLSDLEELDTLTSAMTCDSRLVVLDVDADSCRTRNAARAIEEQWAFDGYEELAREMQSYRSRGVWVESSRLSPGATANLALAQLL